jgi:hypothetical protein
MKSKSFSIVKGPLSLLLMGVFLVWGGNAWADDTASDTAATIPVATTATPTAVPGPVVTVDGLVDSYFSYNFSNPSGAPTTPNNSLWYNTAADSYTLGLAEAKINATQGQVGGHLVLAYGEENNGLGIGTGTSGFDVLQAYVTYNPGQWTFNFGRFVSWMGYEVVESTGNWNYSHSLLFNALPFWHTGLSVNYAPTTIFNATVYATDGWNNTAVGTNGQTLGLEIGITPNATWSITGNGIFTPIGNSQEEIVGEGIIVYKPSAWSFALDGQFGSVGVPAGASSPSYFGIALYGKYQIQSDWDVALRLDYLNDSNNNAINAFGGGAGNLYGNTSLAGKGFTGDEVTLTIEHDFTPNLIGRLEGRVDMASYNGSAANVFDNNTSSNQGTATAALAYTF